LCFATRLPRTIFRGLVERLDAQDGVLAGKQAEIEAQEARLEELEDTCLALVRCLKEVEDTHPASTPGNDGADAPMVSLTEYIKAEVEDLARKTLSSAIKAAAASSEAETGEPELYGTCFGYLSKLTSGKGISSKKFKKRWFVIKSDGRVQYYHTMKESTNADHAANAINLEGYTITTADYKEKGAFKASCDKRRTFYFLTDPVTDEQRTKWMTAFSEAAKVCSGGVVPPRPTLERSASSSASLMSIGTAVVAAAQTKPEPAQTPVAPTTPVQPPAQRFAAHSHSPDGEAAAASADAGGPTFSCSEETLAAATCHGWLTRQGPNDTWCRIYYVLEGKTLFYFNNATSTVPLGSIAMPGTVVDIVMEDDIGGKERGLSVEHGGQTTVLCAATDEEYGVWVPALTNVAQS